jgi:hypothetical protein
MVRAARFSIRRYDSLQAMKADEYEYWQRRPAHERMGGVTELTASTYGRMDLLLYAFRLFTLCVSALKNSCSSYINRR